MYIYIYIYIYAECFEKCSCGACSWWEIWRREEAAREEVLQNDKQDQLWSAQKSSVRPEECLQTGTYCKQCVTVSDVTQA